MKENLELSIIILCYRSEEQIIPFIEKIEVLANNLNVNYELVLVANYLEGSNDKTGEIVSKIAKNKHNIKTVCKPKKGMMGWDMKEGLTISSGKYLCVIDGDDQFPIGNITKSYNLIKEGNFDLVKTYRIQRGDGLYRKLISNVFNIFFKILFPLVKSKDVNSKPKIFSQNLFSKMNLESNDWFIDAEIMIEANKLNAKFYEFPTVFNKLEGRKSFVKFNAIIEFIKNLIQYKIKELKG